MLSLSATSAGALMNVLALLGMAFLLSNCFGFLRSRPKAERTVSLAIAFGAMAVVSMMSSFPVGPGFIGDLRNVVIAIAAIVGGPLPALTAAAAAAALRVYFGGQLTAAFFGIGLATALSIGFAHLPIAKSSRNLALFGALLAVVNASVLLIPWAQSTLSVDDALQMGTTFFALGVIIYPAAIIVLAGLLNREQHRADEEAKLRTANAELSLESRRTQGVFERSAVALAWCDLQVGRIVLANPQFAAFTGYSQEELAGLRFEDLSPAEDRITNLDDLNSSRSGTASSFNDERRFLRKDGTIVWGLRSLTAVREKGEPRYVFVMVQDITERKRARAEIAYLATHDSLTSLVNRIVFHSELAEASARRKADEVIGVLYINLDDFKEINDTRGRSTGDTVLIEVARRLRRCAGESAVIARFTADEFAILSKTASTVDEIRDLAELVMATVRQPYVAGIMTTVEASIGVALGPRDGLDAEEIMKKADIALDVVKAEGGGKLGFFEPEMEQRLLIRQALKVDLTAALSKNELEIEYQPIVDLRTGKVTSFEALLRWRHPERGIIAPIEFIPLAEETGLIIPIGDWVLNNACAEALKWPARVGIAVNVSPLQFQGRPLAHRVAEVLSATGLDPHRLELEITESVLLHESEDNLLRLNELRELGVKIALDDFGVGYSSLGYLQRFPFNKIKIDRSFVANLASHEESRAVVKAVIELGHALNMRITAEGVETQEQLDRITAKNCDEAQGYHMSRPVPRYAVLALIAELEMQPLRSRRRRSA
jgi:diguanylate cyclase (GGDEF)-like protein/PAS domain S-box-containing protein